VPSTGAGRIIFRLNELPGVRGEEELPELIRALTPVNEAPEDQHEKILEVEGCVVVTGQGVLGGFRGNGIPFEGLEGEGPGREGVGVTLLLPKGFRSTATEKVHFITRDDGGVVGDGAGFEGGAKGVLTFPFYMGTKSKFFLGREII